MKHPYLNQPTNLSEIQPKQQGSSDRFLGVDRREHALQGTSKHLNSDPEYVCLVLKVVCRACVDQCCPESLLLVSAPATDQPDAVLTYPLPADFAAVTTQHTTKATSQ